MVEKPWIDVCKVFQRRLLFITLSILSLYSRNEYDLITNAMCFSDILILTCLNINRTYLWSFKIKYYNIISLTLLFFYISTKNNKLVLTKFLLQLCSTVTFQHHDGVYFQDVPLRWSVLNRDWECSIGFDHFFEIEKK